MSWIFGNINFATYGVMVSRSAGVLDLPKLKTEGHDWLDEDGLEYWQSEAKYNDREIVLNCWMYCDTGYDDFKSKVATLTAAIKTAGKVTFQTPYIDIDDCSISKGIVLVRETNYVQVQQVGTFTLRITVPGDIDYNLFTFKRFVDPDEITAAVVKSSNAKISKDLHGESTLSLSFESNTILDIQAGSPVNKNRSVCPLGYS